MKNNSVDSLRKDFITKRRLMMQDVSIGQPILTSLNKNILVVLRDIERINPKNMLVIGFYWPIQGEPSITDTLLELQNSRPQIKLALPKCSPNEPLSFHEWSSTSLMEKGFANIPEPVYSVPLALDLLIVPCVGWQLRNQQICRLGYGGGFYDRTLELWNTKGSMPFTLGVSFDFAEIPSEIWCPKPHDFPLNSIVTESQIHLPSSN